jgi:Steigviridae/Suoliviridae L,D-carboxypeptidase/transpeptidase
MKLLLTRQVFTEKSTIGTLTVDGVVTCHTLEDRRRRDDPATVADEGRKVPGSTAIPPGRYPVELTVSQRAAEGSLWSPRADHKLPLLIGVPGFEGVRIHAGNDDRATEATT